MVPAVAVILLAVGVTGNATQCSSDSAPVSSSRRRGRLQSKVFAIACCVLEMRTISPRTPLAGDARFIDHGPNGERECSRAQLWNDAEKYKDDTAFGNLQ